MYRVATASIQMCKLVVELRNLESIASALSRGMELTVWDRSIKCLFVVAVTRERVGDTGQFWFNKPICHWVIETLCTELVQDRSRRLIELEARLNLRFQKQNLPAQSPLSSTLMTMSQRFACRTARRRPGRNLTPIAGLKIVKAT